MRRILAGVLVLVALSLCCLVAGTPVNNDPSPAASTAGIHLSQPVTPRAAVGSIAPLFVGLAIVLVLSLAARATSSAPGIAFDGPSLRSLVLAHASRRRGPPAPLF